ncbi:MAG: hypothetical protein AAF360_14825 [Pseudomonadota bacterium]
MDAKRLNAKAPKAGERSKPQRVIPAFSDKSHIDVDRPHRFSCASSAANAAGHHDARLHDGLIDK